MNQYFITIKQWQPKNKLEEMMERRFAEFEHKIIRAEMIPDLREAYNNVYETYKRNKGRSETKWSDELSPAGTGDIFIYISTCTPDRSFGNDFLHIILTRVRGLIQ